MRRPAGQVEQSAEIRWGHHTGSRWLQIHVADANASNFLFNRRVHSDFLTVNETLTSDVSFDPPVVSWSRLRLSREQDGILWSRVSLHVTCLYLFH